MKRFFIVLMLSIWFAFPQPVYPGWWGHNYPPCSISNHTNLELQDVRIQIFYKQSQTTVVSDCIDTLTSENKIKFLKDTASLGVLGDKGFDEDVDITITAFIPVENGLFRRIETVIAHHTPIKPAGDPLSKNYLGIILDIENEFDGQLEVSVKYHKGRLSFDVDLPPFFPDISIKLPDPLPSILHNNTSAELVNPIVKISFKNLKYLEYLKNTVSWGSCYINHMPTGTAEVFSEKTMSINVLGFDEDVDLIVSAYIPLENGLFKKIITITPQHTPCKLTCINNHSYRPCLGINITLTNLVNDQFVIDTNFYTDCREYIYWIDN